LSKKEAPMAAIPFYRPVRDVITVPAPVATGMIVSLAPRLRHREGPVAVWHRDAEGTLHCRWQRPQGRDTPEDQKP
jgi:hypothetical protein